MTPSNSGGTAVSLDAGKANLCDVPAVKEQVVMNKHHETLQISGKHLKREPEGAPLKSKCLLRRIKRRQKKRLHSSPGFLALRLNAVDIF